MRGHFLLWKKTRKQYILIQRVFKIWNFNHKGVFPFVHVYYRLLNGILFYFFINLFIYLFLSALGLCYCTWAFSSCGELGLHFIAVHRLLTAVASLVAQSTGSRHVDFSSCGTWAQWLWIAGSRTQAQQLWCSGFVAQQHVGSSLTRARTHVPCIGGRILNHCATREVPEWHLRMYTLSSSES